MKNECNHGDDLICNDCSVGKNIVTNVACPTINISELFQHMWNQDPTTQYHVHSPEFLRET